MAGLGVSENENTTFLGIAGGYIWQKKDKDGNPVSEDHPRFRKQKYEFSGEEKERCGLQYDDFTGNVVSVVVKDGNYGEQLMVTMEADGENYTISMGTNNRNSQNFFAALLVADLTQPLFISPYDFPGKDQEPGKPNGKRVVGISFKQGGQKLDLNAVEDVPKADDSLYKKENKKKLKRYFEDLNDWYVEQINLKVVPQLAANTPVSEAKVKETSKTVEESEPATPTKAEARKEVEASKTEIPQTNATKAPSTIAMRKAIKAYAQENYEGVELPKLNKEQVAEWYALVQEGEELPFPDGESESPVQEAEVPQSDLSAQLGSLLGS